MTVSFIRTRRNFPCLDSGIVGSPCGVDILPPESELLTLPETRAEGHSHDVPFLGRDRSNR